MKLLAVLGLLVTAGSASAQLAGSMKDVISGSVVPLVLRLEELDGQWRKVSSGSGGSSEGFGQAIASIYGLGSSTFYTLGQSIKIGGKEYIIAYSAEKKPLNFRDITNMMSPPEPEPLTRKTKLWLALLNLDSLGNLTDIRPFSLEEEIKESTPATSAADSNTSVSNLKQVGLALLMYAQDYDEVLPPMKTPAQAKKALMPYCKNEKIFVTPTTKEPYVPNPILSGKKLKQISQPAAFVAFYEPSPINGTRGVAFLDGHVKRVSEAEWARLKKASKIAGSPGISETFTVKVPVQRSSTAMRHAHP